MVPERATPKPGMACGFHGSRTGSNCYRMDASARRQRGLSSACVALLAQLDSLQQGMADHLDSFKLTRHMHPVAATGSGYDR